MTNLEVLMSKDEDKIAKLLNDNGMYAEGVCDTPDCPYLKECHEHDDGSYKCPLTDEAQIKIWLHQETIV